MSVGKRIYLKRRMPDPELVKAFETIPASNVADVMGRNCAMNPRIHLVSSPKKQMMSGVAYTVKARGGDNLALHAALNLAGEGDVIVVSNEEDSTRSLIGEVMMSYLLYTKKIAGIVLDKGYDVIYVSSPDFFGKMEASRFDPSGDADTLLRTAATADLLILDDLGTEFVTPYFITTFYSLLNNRLGAGLPTIVTTNITDGSLLEKRYTEKISSRLSAFVPFNFVGEDIRAQKASE